MESSSTQQSGIAGLQSLQQPAALMGQINSTTLLRAPASILKNIQNKNTATTISGQMASKPKLIVPDVIACRSRLDSTASCSMVSTRDDASDEISVFTSGNVSSACQKSMSTFIREPPQPMKDPCCRIMEPSGIICPENDNRQIKASNLLRIPPKVKSYEEPTKK